MKFVSQLFALPGQDSGNREATAPDIKASGSQITHPGCLMQPQCEEHFRPALHAATRRCPALTLEDRQEPGFQIWRLPGFFRPGGAVQETEVAWHPRNRGLSDRDLGDAERPWPTDLPEEICKMSWKLNRRELLLAGGAAWLGAGAFGKVLGASQKSTKKILFFTKSSGFQHGPITRGKQGS